MGAPVTVLYFYRTRWGAHDEFVGLFRKNHWPVLREQLTAGRFTAVEMSVPRFHGDGRADWDLLVSITFRDWPAMEEHSDAEIAARISSVRSCTAVGSPVIRCRPRTSIDSSGCSGVTDPPEILIVSAVREPIASWWAARR